MYLHSIKKNGKLRKYFIVFDDNTEKEIGEVEAEEYRRTLLMARAVTK